MTSQSPPNVPAPRRRAAWRRCEPVMTNGHALAVFEAGRSDAQAPVVLLVHGMGHWTQAAWDTLAAMFEATHRIVAFDLPGFGDSAKPRTTYSLAFFVAALRAVVVAHGLHRFALAGHSLGGMIAADYAARYPGDVRLLALIAPAGFLRTPKLLLRISASPPLLWLLGRLRPPRAFVRRALELAVHDPAVVPPDVHEHAYALSRDPAVSQAFFRIYAGAAKDLMRVKLLHARFARWRGPTLIVWGKLDRYVPIRALANARRVYPTADVLEIERCGHCPNVEFPELVAERWLANGI